MHLMQQCTRHRVTNSPAHKIALLPVDTQTSAHTIQRLHATGTLVYAFLSQTLSPINDFIARDTVSKRHQNIVSCWTIAILHPIHFVCVSRVCRLSTTKHTKTIMSPSVPRAGAVQVYTKRVRGDLRGPIDKAFMEIGCTHLHCTSAQTLPPLLDSK